jgi:hypothetical protein
MEGLFGKLAIHEISKTSGSMKNETTIRQQIGKQLYIDSSKVVFDFLGNTTRIENATYQLRVSTDETAKGKELKGTSYFYGYKTGRDKVFKLVVSNKLPLSHRAIFFKCPYG